MKQTTSKLLIIIIAICLASLSVSGQHRHRRSRQPVPKINEVKPVNVNQTTPEETARLAEECSLSDRPKPETATRMALLCGKAISLPKPTYPEGARVAKVSGPVSVSAVTDESGRVIWAKAINGHPLLQGAAVKAACLARYSPTLIRGRAVKVETLITYNFIKQ
jgi:TonB family protein